TTSVSKRSRRSACSSCCARSSTRAAARRARGLSNPARPTPRSATCEPGLCLRRFALADWRLRDEPWCQRISHPWLDCVLLALAASLAALLVRLFNALIRARNACRDSRAGIDVQLTRRHDLVPNLVTAVAGYAAHELAVLMVVTEARSAAIKALGAPQSADAEGRLDGALGTLLARLEAYPDLKASANFLHLQRSLTEIEEQISAARRAFNAQVAAYNNLVETFPTLLVARAAGFATAAFFSSAP